MVLLAASVLIMAVALAGSFRKPVPSAPSGGRELPLEGHGPKARLSRRLLLLIAGALALAWLLALVLATFLNTSPAELGRQEPPSSSVARDGGAPPPSRRAAGGARNGRTKGSCSIWR